MSDNDELAKNIFQKKNDHNEKSNFLHLRAGEASRI